MTPWLSQEEIDAACTPLKQSAAQIRYLRSLGLTVRTKPSGAPLVMRQHAEETLNQQKPKRKAEPDRAGLIASFARG